MDIFGSCSRRTPKKAWYWKKEKRTPKEVCHRTIAGDGNSKNKATDLERLAEDINGWCRLLSAEPCMQVMFH